MCDIIKSVLLLCDTDSPKEGKKMYIPEEIKEIKYSEKDIADRVKELGAALTEEYRGRNPVFLCILKGACVFFTDLIRAVECPIEIGFLTASSYEGIESTGKVNVSFQGKLDIANRDVVLVEDIVDTARTLPNVIAALAMLDPKSMKTVCLLDKPARRVTDFNPDLVGFETEDFFLVGYGLDFDQKFRNLPYIGVYNA